MGPLVGVSMPSSLLTSNEAQCFASEYKPLLPGLGIQREPFLHKATLPWIEFLPHSARLKRLDARLWKLEHKATSGGVLREYLAIDLQRGGAEPLLPALADAHTTFDTECFDNGGKSLLRLGRSVRHALLHPKTPQANTCAVCQSNIVDASCSATPAKNLRPILDDSRERNISKTIFNFFCRTDWKA